MKSIIILLILTIYNASFCYSEDSLKNYSRFDKINCEPPEGFFVKGAYIIPFSPVFGTSFGINDTSYVKIHIINYQKTDTISIIYNGILFPGIYKVVWNGINYKDEEAESGMYYMSIYVKKESAILNIEYEYNAITLLPPYLKGLYKH